MISGEPLSPEEARAWGLVHEIKSELFEIGSEVISIQLERIERKPVVEEQEEQ